MVASYIKRQDSAIIIKSMMKTYNVDKDLLAHQL